MAEQKEEVTDQPDALQKRRGRIPPFLTAYGIFHPQYSDCINECQDGKKVLCYKAFIIRLNK
jgi:hypothetical protein